MKNYLALIALFFCSVFYTISCNSVSYNPKATINNTVTDTIYTCIPCGSSCDTATYKSPGMCNHCHMQLVDKKTITHKTIQPQQLCNINSGNVIFLDVRTPEEFNGTAPEKFGAVKNAINIPVQELQKRMQEIEADKNKPIIVYCSHSHRSPRASYMLTQAGFTNITNMAGGMSVWKEQVKDANCNTKLYITQ
jgi:rhodanese-related sulfurtransferase